MGQPQNLISVDENCPYCGGDRKHSKSGRKACKAKMSRSGGKKNKKKERK